VTDLEYIYKERDEILEIYFLQDGVAGYVLPRYNNAVYIEIEKGDHFGTIDIVYDDSLFI